MDTYSFEQAGAILQQAFNKVLNPDSTPTANSTNLVTSGGVKAAIPDVSQFITKSVNDLVNYYLKSETYTKAEVQALIGAIVHFHYEVYPSTSAVTNPQSNVLYLIGPTGSGSDKYEEYVYPNSTQGWVKIGDTSIDLSGYSTTEEVVAMLNSLWSDVVEELDKKANKDGWYRQLVAGFSENLVDTKGAGTEQEIIERTSCGPESIADDGSGVIQEFRGKSVKWNQQVVNGDHSDGTTGIVPARTSDPIETITVTNGIAKYAIPTAGYGMGREMIAQPVANHKYFLFARVRTSVTKDFRFGGSSILYTKSCAANTWEDVSAIVQPSDSTKITMTIVTSNSILYFESQRELAVDLTAIFGSGNEPTTVAAFEEWRDANLPKLPYYPYTGANGVIINNVGGVLVTDGFQQYNPDTGKVNVLGGNQYQITGAYTALTLDGTTITPDSNGLFTPTKDGELVVTGGNSTTTCVHFTWGGYRNGEYENYWQVRTEANWTKLYGKLNGTGDMRQVAPNGGKSAGTCYDVANLVTKEADIKTTLVNLGEMTYQKFNDNYGFGYELSTNYRPKVGGQFIVSGDIPGVTNISIIQSGTQYVFVIFYTDGRYANATAFKTAVTGYQLTYERNTSAHYTNLKYSDDGGQTFYDIPTVYKVADFGTERIEPLTDEQGNPAITAFRAVIKYNNDFTREIVNLPKNYVKATEAQDFSDSEKARARANIGAISQEELEPYAKKDGVEDNLVAGAAKSLYGDTVKSGEFVFRQVQGGSGLARFKAVKGKSLVWNNIANYSLDYTAYSFDGTQFVVKTAAPAGWNSNNYRIAQLKANHKYFFAIKAAITLELYDYNLGTPKFFSTSNGARLYSPTSDRSINLGFEEGTELGTYSARIVCIDLTQMEIASQISSASDFLRLFPMAPYASYNAGSILSNTTTAMEHRGFNQWDEETELGILNITTGENSSSTTQIRSKNYIPVLGGSTYYAKSPSAAGIWMMCYDASKTMIPSPNISTEMAQNACNVQNKEFTLPSSCAYVRFYITQQYGTTYKNDICINLSDPSRNGTYEPYSKRVLALNIPTMMGKKIVNGSTEGQESVNIFAAMAGTTEVFGMKGVGTAFDFGQVEADGYIRKVTKKMSVMNLGNYTWARNTSYENPFFYATMPSTAIGQTTYGRPGVCSKYTRYAGLSPWSNLPNKSFMYSFTGFGGTNLLFIRDDSYTDAATFKTAMANVPLVFELATPEEYVLDTPIYLGYQADADGTEMQLPQNEATPTTAPLVADIIYAIDAIKQLNGLPVDYQSQDSMDSLLTALGTALGFTWSKTWDGVKYVYTITNNS